MKDKENLKKQIIYRSTHRGSKEMDLLVGSFVKDNIDSLSYKDLSMLKIFIDTDDEILKSWYFENASTKSTFLNKVIKKFKKFKL